MTRAKVLQLGLLVLLLGGVGYFVFRMFGLDPSKAGIASEALLILLLIVWTGSYFFRVITGNMTFMEQRKRYRKAYEEMTEEKIKEKFEAMSPEEKIALIEELEKESNETN